MKKWIIAILALLVFASPSWANSIGNTSDAAVTTGPGYLKGLIVHTDATNACTVSVYDNTAASGTKLFSTWTVTTSATDRTQALSFDDNEVPYGTGIYVDITVGGGGTCTYDVYFESR
jgi:hypothetical protein